MRVRVPDAYVKFADPVIVFVPEPNATCVDAMLPPIVPEAVAAIVTVPTPGVTVIPVPAVIESTPVSPFSDETSDGPCPSPERISVGMKLPLYLLNEKS